MALLKAEGLSVAYGTVRAVRGISLEVAEGEIVALLGPNGAGKTTTLMAIMGLVPSTAGRVVFAGVDVTNGAPERIVRSGMTLVPEGRRVFGGLTVGENLRLGAVGATGRAPMPESVIYDLFPILADRQSQLAGTLSGGEQQQLAIARALRSAPRLLLLDEPSLGLAPQVVEGIFDLLAELRTRGTTILVVEQNVNLALETAERAYVLSSGSLYLAGRCSDLLASNRGRSCLPRHRSRLMEVLVQQLVNALALGGTYAMLALGIAIVFSILGLVNFAHGELLTVTGYTLFFYREHGCLYR